MITIIAAFIFFGLALSLLAVGVIFRKKALLGSCGAASKLATLNGVEISCETCTTRGENPDCSYNEKEKS